MNSVIRRLIIVFIFCFSYGVAFAETETEKAKAAAVPVEDKRVEAEGTVVVGDDTTIGQAKASALNNARRAALEKATGILVHSSSTAYNYQLINDLVVAATKGIIVKETVIQNNCRSDEGYISCGAKIEAYVRPLFLERRGNFAVKVAYVARLDKKAYVKNPVFQTNDEIRITASANQDAYLNLFNIDQYGNVSKLYPNTFSRAERIPAETEIVFPNDIQRKMGIQLRVRPPKGVKQAVESVLIIATKEKTKLLSDTEIENPTITDLMRELSEIDPSLWVDKTVGYEVRE